MVLVGTVAPHFDCRAVIRGGLRRLRAMVRCYRTASGERRYMGIVEDRSVEEERDLAHLQIGALMDTAGVGIATFEESSGWVRQRGGSGSACNFDERQVRPSTRLDTRAKRRERKSHRQQNSFWRAPQFVEVHA